jgi:2-aminoethylphosphonate transport system substrate-binding protein
MKTRHFLRATAIAAVTLAAMLSSACGGTGSSGSGAAGAITVYSADGLGSWYKSTFDAFTKDTGIAVLVLLQHLRGRDGALDYLTKLQANNVGPSSSTGKLQPKVSNGELLVANGDVQMNLGSIKDDKSTFSIFIPVHDGKRTTVSLPYVAGVTKGAPHADNAKKLLSYLLTNGVQKTVAAGALGIPVRDNLVSNGAPQPNTSASVLDGVDVWVPDWNAVLAGLDADLAAYQKATGN